MWTKQAPQFDKEVIYLGTPVEVLIDDVHTGFARFKGIVSSFSPFRLEVTYYNTKKNKMDTCTVRVDRLEEGKVEMIPLVPLHDPKTIKRDAVQLFK